MTVYVDYHPPCDRKCVRCKEWKNFMNFQEHYYSKADRYLLQYKHTVTSCKCLDAMKEYNTSKTRKSEGHKYNVITFPQG